MNNTGLVLEGGGMRGLYTCGVLEFFMEQELYFQYIIGVSAGACNAASYISKQKGRNIKVNTGFLNDWRYMSLRNLIFTKSFFGMDFIFKEIPGKLVPFDYETFFNSQGEFLVGTTDCKTGKAVYFHKDDLREGFDALQASSSLPLLSPIVHFKGYELLDGGIADSIPIAKSMEDGNEKNIVVLTRNKGYRKSPARFGKIIKLKYKKYPLLVESIINRYQKYNETLDTLEDLEAQGKVLVIRPAGKIKVDRFERSPAKLHELFKNGYRDAENCYAGIQEFIH
jgi:predicted patatin/cPLA2 family phospholipase